MVFKDSQAIIEAALATFVIGELDLKPGRSNQGSKVKTTLRSGSVFRSDDFHRLSPVIECFEIGIDD